MAMCVPSLLQREVRCAPQICRDASPILPLLSEVACLLSWMRCREEGKLLARAAGFLITLGKRTGQKEPDNSALKFPRHAQENLSLFAGPCSAPLPSE